MKTATIYQLSEPLDLNALDAMPAIDEPPPFSMGAVGRIDIDGAASMALDNSGAWYRFRAYKKAIPPTAIKREVAARTTDLMTRKEIKELAQLVTDELGSKVPFSHADIDVAVTSEYLIIGCGAKQAEEVTGVMREKLNGLRITPYPVGFDLRACVMPMINTGQLEVNSITLNGDLKADFGESGTMTLKASSLESEVLEILKHSTGIKSAMLGWGDIIATVNQDGGLSSIKTDLDSIHGETDYDGNNALQRLAEVLYLSKELPKMMGDLILHSGAK